MFLYLIQVVGRGFRAIKILTDIAADTKQVILKMYPHPYSVSSEKDEKEKVELGTPDRIVQSQIKSGGFVAFDQTGLTEIAVRNNCVIELVAAVGEFVAEGQPLFRIYGDKSSSIADNVLMRCVMFDLERTLEQDPDFGFRMIVDIAGKALSPAINDPTTGVLAIDQIQHLLALLGQREIAPGIIRDDGELRLVFPQCDWDDFVTLAATEIRHYGGPNPQVTRRLQAMFEYLLDVLPEPRKAAIRREVALLRKTVEQTYGGEQDREIAAKADPQGFGAHRHGTGAQGN